jgi:hypothetical protein
VFREGTKECQCGSLLETSPGGTSRDRDINTPIYSRETTSVPLDPDISKTVLQEHVFPEIFGE